MVRYILWRCLHALLVFFAVSVVARAMLNAMPGDPVDNLRKASPRPLSADDVERLRRHYGLDDPFLVQYGKWLRQLAAGDLGYSLSYRVPVDELLWPALGRTLLLTGCAFFLSIPA